MVAAPVDNAGTYEIGMGGLINMLLKLRKSLNSVKVLTFSGKEKM